MSFLFLAVWTEIVHYSIKCRSVKDFLHWKNKIIVSSTIYRVNIALVDSRHINMGATLILYLSGSMHHTCMYGPTYSGLKQLLIVDSV